MGKSKSATFWILLILAIVGVLAGLGFGFMNSVKAGWASLTGDAPTKAQLKTLDDATTAILNQDKTKNVTITITAV